ncbi:MAG: hypothetical protein HOC74_40775 [Gemmatimonadetes bacterium]|nr:hypothetical protein [Gemmatimonadota bacterium]
MSRHAKRMIAWLIGVGILVGSGVWAEDERLKKGEESPRNPDYTYEEEMPRQTMTVPGASSGVFYERHRYGDQFIGRWRSEYLNYGWKDYENYRLNTTPYLRNYDTFGNYIAEGYEVFRLEEFRTREPELGSLLKKGQFYQNWLRHLVIADDAYGGWNTRLMVGDFIHTTFTPLTLDMAAFNGVRFDAISSADKKLTLLVSRISDPVKMRLPPLARTDLGRQGQKDNIQDGVYLVGGHWETSIGENLTLGTSYVNLYRFDSRRGIKTNSRKGLAPQNTVPQSIIVRFEDDSPDDPRSGAAVFDIVAEVTLAPPIDSPDEEETVIRLEPVVVELGPGAIQQRGFIEAAGTFRDEAGSDRPVYVDYVFEVGENATDVQFSALVANDYRVSIRQKHFYVTDAARGSGEKRETGFATIRRAEGNVVDMSNQKVVHFDYGLATGVEVLGVNGKLRIPGFDIQGEIVKSDNHYQYPTTLGKRSGFDDLAGYLVVDKHWKKIGLAVEMFSIGPKFTSLNPHPNELTPEVPTGEVFYFNEPRQSFYRSAATLTNNPFYGLVDDNDNMLYNEMPDNFLQSGRPLETYSGNTLDQSPILPFFDLDQDGRPDTNRDRNNRSDYDQPFLMYFTDPEDFYFGDDFNNNFLTDAWEDDLLPNYPYYKDERGMHLATQVEPLRGMELAWGRYDVERIADEGSNDVVYGRLHLDREITSRWLVRWDHEIKDVEDDIPNDYFRFLLREDIGGYTRTFFEDHLDARSSLINRGLLDVRFHPARYWNIESKFSYSRNHQRRHQLTNGEVQEEDDIDFYGAVFRTDYTYFWNGLMVNPRVKFLYRIRERASLGEPTIEDFQFIPIIRADLRLTPRTQLRFGMQGFPGLVDRRRDFVEEANDSERMSWTLMLFSESEYEGYVIGTEVGFRSEDIDYDDPTKPDYKYNRFFIRMISAVGKVVR